MARTTRDDSSRDITSRQTSRRSSSDTSNARGAASSGASTGKGREKERERGRATQDTNRGTQARGTSGTSETIRGAQTSQSNASGQSDQASRSNVQDQERSIETRTETGRGQAQEQTGGAGLSRRQGTSPVLGTGAFVNPFAAMRRWSDDMDRLFQDFGLGLGFRRSPFRELAALGGRLGSDENDISDWSPQVEAFQRGDKFVVRADLPGMKKDDVTVEVENNTLTISGERTHEHEENREGYYRSERSYGNFYRAIPLPEGVNADQCEATFKDGVLEVSLKAPQQREKSRQIPIR